MSDIKLFKLNESVLEELESGTFAFERELQKLIEDNMETVLGIKFLASEYTTGKEHGGRIDSLGIDENYCPVIIEYKRSVNENVINQGLFYLDWLMDHKAAFQLLVIKTLGQEYTDKIEWSIPRLLCIASNFTKYDEHAVKQMNRNIELIRYKKYDDNTLLIEQVVAGSGDTHDKASKKTQKPQTATHRTTQKTFGEIFNQVDDHLRNLYLAVADYIENLGDDVQKKELKHYVAFKRLKNFICVDIKPQVKCIRLYLHLNLKKVDLSNDMFRDVSGKGFYGTGDLEITISSMEDFKKIKDLLTECYDAN